MAETLAPDYMKHFKCIGAACEDTCCAGWYIGIDANTLKKYKKVKDPVMKKRLDKEVVEKRGGDEEHAAKIKLKNNRCAFLSKEGWCDIYSSLGEGYLSKTCTLYPRTINKVENTLEYSVALSCPEAARKVLLNEKPMVFEAYTEAGKTCTISGEIHLNSQKPQKWQDYFVKLRFTMIEIMQNRNLSIEERLLVLEDFLVSLNKTPIKRIPELMKHYEKQQAPVSKEAAAFEDLFALGLKLKAMAEEKKWPSKRYEAFYLTMLEGLKDLGDLKAAKQQFVLGEEKYYKPFLKQYAYVLENYFVNYMFERAVPIDGKSPLESLKKLKLYYEFIKLHLVGMSLAQGGLEVMQVVDFIQAFSKTFDHNELYIHKLLKEA